MALRKRKSNPKPKKRVNDAERCERCEFPFDEDLPRLEDSVDLGEKIQGEWKFYAQVCVECAHEIIHKRQNNNRPIETVRTTYPTTSAFKTEHSMT